MSKGLSRTPPASVRYILRQEVNFGCPVCGSPFLSWHHFDPPWEPFHQHNSEGMIALCLQHHKEADAGAFTPAQLRILKTKPFLRDAKPRGRFNWQRRRILMEVGNNYYLSPDHVLRVIDKDIVSIVEDNEGLQTVSLDMRDSSGNPILKMEANDWVVMERVDDIVCPPSANRLEIQCAAYGVSLNLRFSEFTSNKLRNRILNTSAKLFQWMPEDWRIGFWDDMRHVITQWPVTLCTITGSFVWPLVLNLRSNETVLHETLHLGMNLTVGGGLIVGADGSFA